MIPIRKCIKKNWTGGITPEPVRITNKPNKSFHFIPITTFLLLALFGGESFAQKNVVALKQKADKSVVMLQEKIANGCDVLDIVPKMNKVKMLGQQLRIEKVHRLLDEIFKDFAALKCGAADVDPSNDEFINDRLVKIKGYDGDVMEAFITRDNQYLFFNDMKTTEKDKDIFWAKLIDNYTFEFMGEIENINTRSVEGVPTMDRLGNFYFISGDKYSKTLVTMYGGKFYRGAVRDIKPLSDLSLGKIGWLNMDSEISSDGKTIYSTHSYFGEKTGFPTQSYFFYAKKQGGRFIPQGNSDEIFKEINKDEIVYGLTISEDQREILYTRLLLPGFRFETLRAVRDSKDSPFKKPEVVNYG